MDRVLITNTNNGQISRAAPVNGDSHNNQFSETLRLSKADALLRTTTSQYRKWTALRQNNGAIAVKIADSIIARHEILKNAKQGQAVDWSHFDALTQEIKAQGISLFNSLEIPNRYKERSPNNPLKNESGNGAIHTYDGLNHNLDKNKALESTKQVEPLPATKTSTIDPKTTIVAEKNNPPASGNNQALDKAGAPNESVKVVAKELNEPFSLSDDYFVLTNIEYEQYLLGHGLTGYGDPDHLFLAFQEIADVLDLNIQTDPESGTAKGWFISEGRSFSLNLGKNQAQVDGKTMALPSRGIQIIDDTFFVDTKLLSQWFPVDFKYDYTRQSVKVKPREQLPFQARMEREGRWIQKGRQTNQQAVLPRKDPDYKWVEYPYIDVDLSTGYRTKQTNNNAYAGLELHATGDLGKMSSEIDLDVSTDEKIEDFTFKLERKDPDNKLLGPLKASSIEIGDIDSVYIPGATRSADERGIKISNEKLFQANDFDTTFFRGTLKPDWDVELYRNGVLIDSMRVDENGKYEFTDVSTYYGPNDFKIVAYGPKGQKEVETKSINIGQDLLKVGQGEYNVSVTQKNAILDEIYDDDDQDPRDEGSITANASYDYGLTDQMSVGAGISSQEISEERHHLIDLNVKRNFLGFNLRGDFLYDTEGGSGMQATAKTRLGEFGLNFEQSVYNDLLTRNYFQSKFSASRVFRGNSILPSISTGLDLRKTFYDDYDITNVALRLSTIVKGIALRNYLDWTESTHPQQDTDELNGLDGTLNADVNIGKLRIAGELGYEITPDFKITDAAISSSIPITDNLSSSLYLQKDFEDDDSTEMSLGLNWKKDNGRYVISPVISHDSDGETTVALVFSTSIGKDPSNKKIRTYSRDMADNGKASVKVYHDKNNNAVFDEDDEILKGVAVNAVQSYNTAKTDEDGVAFLPDLRNHKPTDVVIDPSTLENPFLEPSTPGNSIVPRPGHVHALEIPLAAVGEIDGTIYKKGDDGWNEPLSHVKIQLLDESGTVVQEVFSEFDGFYYLQKVFPGKYFVRIDPESKKSQGRIIDPIPVEIGNDGTIENGLDFIIGNDSPMIAADNTPVIQDKTKSAETTIPNKSVEKSMNLSAPAIAGQENVPSTKPEKPESTIAMVETKTAPSVKEATPAIAPAKQDVPASRQTFKPQKETVSSGMQTPVIAAGASLSDLGGKAQNTDSAIQYSLHLSSYRTADRAAAGIDYLLQKHKGVLKDTDFIIKRVKVSDEKGIWYRVMAGQSGNRKEIERMRKQIKMASPYCKVVELKTNGDEPEHKGVHLTSFRKRVNAQKSVQELKAQYPSLLNDISFTIQETDLGPNMGKWQRVIAGRFPDEQSAALLSQKVKMKAPYAKVMELGKQSDIGIHMASFRTRKNAVTGLKILQRKYGSLFKNQEFSIHRVNLGGEKGSWYRIIAGRFDDKQAARTVQNLLKEKNQYSKIMRF